MQGERDAGDRAEDLHVGADPWRRGRGRPCSRGSEAGAADDHELSQAIHLALLNRGAMITPFHNMMLVCPATTGADIDHLLAAFDAVLDRLTA